VVKVIRRPDFLSLFDSGQARSGPKHSGTCHESSTVFALFQFYREETVGDMALNVVQ
jgi:hypothetical protein